MNNCYTHRRRINTLSLILLLFIQIQAIAGNDNHKDTPLPDRDKDSLSFHLPGVVVTAIRSTSPGSISLLPATAIEHVQPVTMVWTPVCSL